MNWAQFVCKEHINEQDQEKLMSEMYHQMFAVAYSKMNNTADALDIVQESWLKILQKIGSLKDRNKLLQWAKVIVSNTACTALHKRYHHMLAVINNNGEVPLQNEQSVASEVETNFLKNAVIASLFRLDEQTRKMLIYKYYYGLRDQDISNVLGLPLGTVKARMHRAKCRLRDDPFLYIK